MNITEALQQLADNTDYINNLVRRLEERTMHRPSVISELREIVIQNHDCIEVIRDGLE